MSETKKRETLPVEREKKKGLHWILELLVFGVLFIVLSLGQVLFMLPGELALLKNNAEYQAALAVGDQALLWAVTEKIAASDTYMVLTLFSTVTMIALVLLFCKLFQKRGPATLGFVKKGALKEYLLGLAAGFAVFSIAVLICLATGALRIEISGTFRFGMFALFTVGFMLQGMAEEVLCRGYLLVSVKRRYPVWVAILMNAFLFAALHLANDGISFLAFINLALFGIFASLYFIKRGSIWGIGAFHSIWNLAQGNFYGIKVSGMTTACSVFTGYPQDGKSLLHGGAFGLEGGLAVTFVLVPGCCLLGYLLYAGKKAEEK